MSTEKFVTESAKETQKIAVKFAEQVLQRKPKNHAVVLGLQGDLGAGKTTFFQGFAKGLGIKEKITSPTFIIMRKFKMQKSKIKMTMQNAKFTHLYHFDCYRLNDPEEILNLGLKEIISNPENIIAIEWPEKIKKLLPKNIILIKFEHLKENKREMIRVNYCPDH